MNSNRKFLMTLATFGLTTLSGLANGQDISYEDTIAPIVAENCVRCHSGSRPRAGVVLDNQDDLIANGEAAIQQILAGRMPRGNPGFGATAEGSLLVDWLELQVQQ